MAAEGQHRRATDGQSTEGQPTERRAEASQQAPRRRRQDFFQKYRQPLIGLGLVGGALPLVNATANTDAAATPLQPEADEAAADEATAAVALRNDTEETLVSRIAESTAVSSRDSHIRDAMEEFGISEAMASDIYDIAQQEGLEPRVAYGLVRTESTFKETAVSHVGARGLTQVMPRTAKWLVPGTKAEDLYDRKTNLKLGFKYLNQLVDKYRGNMKLALLAYNRGPGTVDKVLKRGGNPDNGYAKKVLGS